MNDAPTAIRHRPYSTADTPGPHRSGRATPAVLHDPRLWRLGREPLSRRRTVATGHTSLDAALPGGGWPLGAVTELFHPRQGAGELEILLPALAELTRRRWLALVAPPHIPYAPALRAAGIDLSRVLLIHPRAAKEALWAVEQALRSGTCGAVMAWPSRADAGSVRRLQLAAEAGESWSILLRQETAPRGPSPAALRMTVEPEEDGLRVDLLKCRGGRPQSVRLPRDAEPGGHRPAPTDAERGTQLSLALCPEAPPFLS